MSNGHTLHLPSSVRRAAVACSAVLVASLVLAPQGSADPNQPSDPADRPTISDVKHRLEVLNRQAEIASESLNTVRVEMSAAQTRLDTLQADVDRQRDRVDTLRDQLVGTAVTNFQNTSSMSSTAAFFTSDDAGQFLETMATDALIEEQQAGLLIRLGQQQKQLGIQEQQAEEALAALADEKKDAAKHQAVLDARTESAEDLLGELEAAERARLARLQAAAAPEVQTSRAAPRVTDVPASERAQVAVKTALDQVGDPYVYGAAGPDAFDCSGLTMYAWAAAGVSIPHSSSAQPSAGTPVSLSSLQPGDLVFYYSPISHAAMYIGNGMIVHAANPSRPVEVVSMYMMPVNMAVRIA